MTMKQQMNSEEPCLQEMNRAQIEFETLTASANKAQYPHYFKKLPAGKTHIDIYRVIQMFDVPAGPVDHAVKKLLALGKRGAKDYRQDLVEARDSLNRALEMFDEDEEQP